MKYKAAIYSGVAVLVTLLPVMSQAQMVTEPRRLSFGQMVVPASGAVVQIQPNGNISTGSNWVVPGSGANSGRYRITGGAGTVDISISDIGTCNPGVVLSNFRANWGGTIYPDISTAPITAAPFDGDEVLRQGARLTYAGTTPLGPCPANFDLNITFY